MKYVLFIFLTTISLAGTNKYHNQNGVGIEGYDPVSYFQSGPAKGDKNFSTSYDGIFYYFKSQANLDKFKSSPKKYLPQFKGWCAFAIADGPSLADINPKTYWINDGKLYLFYNKFFVNTLSSWKKDPAGYLKKAEANWNNRTIK